MWVVRVNIAGKMSVSGASFVDQSEALIWTVLSNQRGGDVGITRGLRGYWHWYQQTSLSYLLHPTSSYKIILILSIWKWFK